ncbi:hypothetical protein [Luteolibacter sp. LG18]|uniref:hypothetical protein n=1 Tax=Luteolibacter sp. LG18 TaxID=2819286 RepID=UPI002B29C7C4|nr:hypothetical protein llg_23990 [Luteolibacter sp. LG18]
MSKYKLMVSGVVGLVALGCIGLLSLKTGPGSGPSGGDEVKPLVPNRSGSTAERTGGSRPAGSRIKLARPELSDARRLKMLDDIALHWDENTRDFKGEELDQKQQDLVREAVQKLGASEEMLGFLQFLKEKGLSVSKTADLLIGGEMPGVFSGVLGKDAREWLLGVKDARLKQTLSFSAGVGYTGGGLKEFIDALGDIHCQSAVLSGYCRTLARTEPENAVKVFMDLRPAKVDFTAMASIVREAPPTADFGKISGMFPDDAKGARNIRTSLMQSWAAVSPVEAGQYVMANTKLAGPSQIGTVVDVWVGSSPEGASAWVGSLPAGPYRDEGNASLAKATGASDPVLGWAYVTRIEDPQKRKDAATKVFASWDKSDHAAAAQAWSEMFPQAD